MHFSPCFFYLGIHGGQRQGKITNVGGFCVQLSKLFFCMALGKLLNFSEVFSLRSDEIFLIYNMRITTIFHALILCQMLKILSILYSLIHSLKSIKVLFILILQMKSQTQSSEITCLRSQGWQVYRKQDFNQGCLTPKPTLSSTSFYYLLAGCFW